MTTVFHKSAVFTFFLLLFPVVGNVFADKLYLKSGEIKEGMVLEKVPEFHDWCDFETHVLILELGGQQVCYKKDNVERIEKTEIPPKPPEGVQLLARADRWGEEKYGYETQLIPMSVEYVIGKPMLFSLVMRNVTNDLKWYDAQGILRPCLIVKNTQGIEAQTKIGPMQTSGGSHPIGPGEMATLFEERDITQEFLITKPGVYSVQFREGLYGFYGEEGWFPASNTLTIEVRPGELQAEDALILELQEMAGQRKWTVNAGWNFGEKEVRPPGRVSVPGCDVSIDGDFIYDGRKAPISVRLWQTVQSADIQQAGQDEDEELSEFLGQNASGYVYALIPSEAEELWPTVRQDIKEALDLSNVLSK